MKTIGYSYACEQGRRPKNEDLCLAVPIGKGQTLFACIDGVGGSGKGEYAAAAAAQAIQSCLSGRTRFSLDDLKMGIVTANNNIIDLQQSPALQDMMCVLTACIVDTSDETVHICHVGDTCLYAIGADNLIKRLTPIHSQVGALLDAGMIDELHARTHKRRHIIARALGIRRLDFFTDYLYTATISLEDIHQIILCTDGVDDVLMPQSIQTVVTQSPSVEQTARELVAAALKYSHDNTSAIAITIEDA